MAIDTLGVLTSLGSGGSAAAVYTTILTICDLFRLAPHEWPLTHSLTTNKAAAMSSCQPCARTALLGQQRGLLLVTEKRDSQIKVFGSPRPL